MHAFFLKSADFCHFIHLLPGSFLNCTASSSLFWGTKSSLMLCPDCQIATWREVVAERWIMPPASAWGPATERCPRRTSSRNAVGALHFARRYNHTLTYLKNVITEFFFLIIKMFLKLNKAKLCYSSPCLCCWVLLKIDFSVIQWSLVYCGDTL